MIQAAIDLDRIIKGKNILWEVNKMANSMDILLASREHVYSKYGRKAVDDLRDKANQGEFYATKQLAEWGNVGSQFSIGNLYKNGNTPERKRDIAKETYWYNKAAEGGLFEAQVMLSDTYFEQGNHEDRKHWLEQAVSQADDQTNPDSLSIRLYVKRNLGSMLAKYALEGSNPKRAFDLLNEVIKEGRPSDQEIIYAKGELGMIYFDEEYTSRGLNVHDPDKGISLIKEWKAECARNGWLQNLSYQCYAMGAVLSAGRFSVSKRDTHLRGRTKDDLMLAIELFESISPNQPYYEDAQKAMEIPKNLLPAV